VSLPTESDFDPYGGDLDAQTAWRNFGGLTLEEANRRFREHPEYYQEDFMFMGGKAFAYYFPIIETYLHETSAANPYDDRQAWILAHCITQQLYKDAPLEVLQLIPRVLNLAEFVLANTDLFDPEPVEGHEAWRELQSRIASLNCTK
jgi:hypothetical protein